METRSQEELKKILHRIDGRGYKAYKDLEGTYRYLNFTLILDHVQGDPFAAPSRVRVHVPQDKAQFPHELYQTQVRKEGLEDYVTRVFCQAIKKVVKGHRGTGHSGVIEMDEPGQEILQRSSVLITPQYVEARFTLGLPAFGRTVRAREAEEMFFKEIPKLVEQALFYRSLDANSVKDHIAVVEDQNVLRSQLRARGLVAFVANGAILPRRSGIDERPLQLDSSTLPFKEEVIPFQSPPDLEIEFQVPNRGTLRGMGIPKGITLIAGGGFHGKSTLLNALERGVYNHIPGDGREYVVTLSEAVKIRAEDGRRVEKVNISPFINNLPFGKDTQQFSTDNASGSTSQAANIMEALEVGAQILLMDEDTCATNFMIRDVRMQELVAKEKEPITPFVDKVYQLYQEFGVSTILVMGGSGDYLDVANTVLVMDSYRPLHVTSNAQEIVCKYRSQRKKEGGSSFGRVTNRIPLRESFDPSRGKREVKISTKGLKTILFGHTSIDLSSVEQLVHIGQTRAIGDILYYYSKKYVNGKKTLQEGLLALMQELQEKGFDILSPRKAGDYALPRIFEVAAAINRLRTLKVR